MTEEELVVEEEKIPELAVAALNRAHRRARALGQPVVFVEGGKLVRMTGDVRVELGDAPPSFKFSDRKIRAKT